MSNFHFVLTIYSHHFSLSKLSPVGRKLANGFANRYVQFGLVPSGGRVVKETYLKCLLLPMKIGLNTDFISTSYLTFLQDVVAKRV